LSSDLRGQKIRPPVLPIPSPPSPPIKVHNERGVKMNILLYIAIMLFGAFLGNRKLIPKVLMKKMDGIQFLCLLLLLFIMGVSIGLDEEVIRSFGTIGVQGIIFALASSVFSIIGVRLIASRVLVKGGEEQ